MNSPVKYELQEGIARITMDDGKVNAMSIELMTAIHNALDQAEKDNAIVVLKGREGVFSAGFDLKQITSNPETSYRQVTMGAELCVRILSFPKPVITVCTGHAYPMGAFLMMSADYRFGVEGPFNIGMNEVMIGMIIPKFALELAASRLTPAHFARTTLTGELFLPVEAVKAGFLDTVVSVDKVEAAVDEKVRGLTKMDFDAYRGTKAKSRAKLIAAMKAAIKEEQTIEKAKQSLLFKAS